MASSIAIRLPLALPGVALVPNGQCYALVPRQVPLRDLIASKVRGELTKARAGGIAASCINLLLPSMYQIDSGIGVVDDQAVAAALHAFSDGRFTVSLDGKVLTDLDAMLDLTPRSRIVFVATPVPTTVPRP